MTEIYPIYEPNRALSKLATITHTHEAGLTVFWDSELRRPLFHTVGNNEYEWWTQDVDGNICQSLSHFLPVSILEDIFVFKKPGHGKAADKQLQYEIYDCEWSDFACEKWYLEFNVWAPRRMTMQ